MIERRVLVAGATGRLGVVVDVLLAQGHSVRAMTRDPTAPAAALLRRAGAEVVYGDFDDLDSVARAAAGVDAMFATGTAHRAGPDGELRHGRNIAQASAAAGVPHLVYSSGDGAAFDSPLPLFRVKHQVEQYIRSTPTPHTILAPVYFMENLFNAWNRAALQVGVFPSPIGIDRPLQQAAIADLASLAAMAIERPDEFAGLRIRVASDELTAVDAAAALTRVTRRPFNAHRVATDGLGPALASLFTWLEQTEQDVDLPALHRRYPEVGWHTYEAWVGTVLPRLDEGEAHLPAAARRGE